MKKDWHWRFDRLLFQYMGFKIQSGFKSLSKPELIAAIEEIGSICKQAADEGARHDLIFDTIYKSSINTLLKRYINDEEISNTCHHVCRDMTIHVDKTKPNKRKIIAYSLQPVFEHDTGSVVTAAFARCLVTGETLASMGGPGSWVSRAFAALVWARGVEMTPEAVKAACEEKKIKMPEYEGDGE